MKPSFWHTTKGVFTGMLLCAFLLPFIGLIVVGEYAHYQASEFCRTTTVLPASENDFQRLIQNAGADLNMSRYMLDAQQTGSLWIIFSVWGLQRHSCLIYAEFGEVTDKKVVDRY